MILYEVNLTINTEIYLQFESWLKTHIKEMLLFPGFIQASILKPETEELPDRKKLTVHYYLESRDDLEVYFTRYAQKMRQQGIALFKDNYSRESRVFEIQDNLLK